MWRAIAGNDGKMEVRSLLNLSRALARCKGDRTHSRPKRVTKFPTPIEIGTAAVQNHVVLPESLQPLVASMIATAVGLDRRLINDYIQGLYAAEGVLTVRNRRAIESVLNPKG